MQRERSQNGLLFTLAFIQFTCVLDFMVMMPLSTILMKEFSITATQFGILVAAYNISGGIVSIISSFYLDGYDRKKIMVFAYVFFILGTIACGFSTGYVSMLLSRLLTGMFSGVLSAAIFSVVADVFPFEKRGTAMGKVMMGIGAAAVIGVPLGNYAATVYTWQMTFFSIAAFATLVFAGILLLIPSMTGHISPDHKKRSVQRFVETVSSANRLRALLLMILLMLGSFSIIPFIPDYMVHNVGITQKEVSLIYVVGGFFSMIILAVSGKLCDRFGSFAVYTALTIIALVPIWFVTDLPKGGLIMVLCATSGLFMFGGSRNVPANTLITSTAFSYQRAGFMSLVAATQQIGGGLAAFAGSLLVTTNADHSLDHFYRVGWFAIAASLVAIPVAYSVKPVKE
ncbi:MAG TPA: MFS transporter [Bacteroidia bacterium]|jgi:predicted MFS family arabinose efflux permease|nr:MFS transporter [Bacteroidia bacterium]